MRERFIELAAEEAAALGFVATLHPNTTEHAVIMEATNDRAESFWITASQREIDLNEGERRTLATAKARVGNGFRTAFSNWMQREGNPRWREDQATILKEVSGGQ